MYICHTYSDRYSFVCKSNGIHKFMQDVTNCICIWQLYIHIFTILVHHVFYHGVHSAWSIIPLYFVIIHSDTCFHIFSYFILSLLMIFTLWTSSLQKTGHWNFVMCKCDCHLKYAREGIVKVHLNLGWKRGSKPK
jgi:hypothetical protein